MPVDPYRHCRLACVPLFVAVLAAGCGMRDIDDFVKQEFLLQDKPVIHLALRGSRQDRTLVCQTFLLTTNESMWISGAELTPADGPPLDPRAIESLEYDCLCPKPYFDYVTGFGYYRVCRPWGPPSYRRYWRRGTYSYYRTSAGIGVPSWYLLGHRAGTSTPHSLQYTFALPEGHATCDGIQLVLHIAIAPQDGKTPTGRIDEGDTEKKDAESIVNGEKEFRLPFAFELTERPEPADAARSQQDASTILHPIEFRRQAPKPAD